MLVIFDFILNIVDLQFVVKIDKEFAILGSQIAGFAIMFFISDEV